MENINSSQSKKQKRIMSIDYLKALAVLLVITNHALLEEQQLKIGGPFWISMAVPIFMILSGYTNSMSAQRRGIYTFKEYFNKDLMKAKLSRLLGPYIIIFILEIILVNIVPVEFQTERTRAGLPLLILFLTGGSGAGSYYLPILIQLLFLFPFMLFVYRRSPNLATTLFILMHLSFDMVASFLPIQADAYRLLVFRYLALVMMGIVLYFYRYRVDSKDKKQALALALVSAAYIFLTNYTKYKPLIFSKWTGTSLPTMSLAVLYVGFGMKYLEIENTNRLTNTLSKIGKASFHIFLVQKLYFCFRIKKFFMDLNISPVVTVIFSIVVCCVIGIQFYYGENSFRKALAENKKDI